MPPSVQQKFSAALDSLIERVKLDRSVLAALLLVPRVSSRKVPVDAEPGVNGILRLRVQEELKHVHAPRRAGAAQAGEKRIRVRGWRGGFQHRVRAHDAPPSSAPVAGPPRT